MRPLYLPAGVSQLERQVAADERERDADRLRSVPRVLGARRVDRQLVDEGAISVPPRDRVGGQLAVQPPAFGGRIVARVGVCRRERQADASRDTAACVAAWA